jgi:hypothetical protein
VVAAERGPSAATASSSLMSEAGTSHLVKGTGEAPSAASDGSLNAPPDFGELTAQAEECRQEATNFAGKPEAGFLLRIAGCFEELATANVAVPPDRSRTVSGNPVRAYAPPRT